LKKNTENFPQFSQGESIFVKIRELFANFDKNILILGGLGDSFLSFSHGFLTIFVSVYSFQYTGKHAKNSNKYPMSVIIHCILNLVFTMKGCTELKLYEVRFQYLVQFFSFSWGSNILQDIRHIWLEN